MRATLREKGRWGKTKVTVIDFNRHGMSILVDRPLEAPKGLRLCLELDELKLPDLYAVIHNCRSTDAHGMKSYRLGVQFRTEATAQFDRVEVEQTLASLERLAEALYRLGRTPAER
jgi:hypothetical protein